MSSGGGSVQDDATIIGRGTFNAVYVNTFDKSRVDRVPHKRVTGDKLKGLNKLIGEMPMSAFEKFRALLPAGVIIPLDDVLEPNGPRKLYSDSCTLSMPLCKKPDPKKYDFRTKVLNFCQRVLEFTERGGWLTDLSRDNIMLDTKDELVLIDFDGQGTCEVALRAYNNPDSGIPATVWAFLFGFKHVPINIQITEQEVQPVYSDLSGTLNMLKDPTDIPRQFERQSALLQYWTIFGCLVTATELCSNKNDLSYSYLGKTHHFGERLNSLKAKLLHHGLMCAPVIQMLANLTALQRILRGGLQSSIYTIDDKAFATFGEPTAGTK